MSPWSYICKEGRAFRYIVARLSTIAVHHSQSSLNVAHKTKAEKAKVAKCDFSQPNQVYG